MEKTIRILSMLVLLTSILGSTLAASPMEVNRDGRAQSSFAPTVAQAPDGSLWAAWVIDVGDDWEIVTSSWNGELWTPAEIVFANPDRWDTMPSLVFDADGVAWLAWSSTTGTDDILHLSHWTDRGWSVPQEVPAGHTIPNRQPVLASAPNGGLWLAWVGFDGNDDEIYAAFGDGHTWSEPQRISSDDADPAAYDTQPRLAVGPDGSVWLAWTGYEKFLDDEIFAARWDGQRWTAEQQVSIDDDMVDAYPSLEIADDGTAWLAWHGRVSATVRGRRIYISRWAGSTGWQTEIAISSPFESSVTEERPNLTLDANGWPHVIWHVGDGQAGIGYTAFDGVYWSSPRWVVQDAVIEGACLTDGNMPLFIWWTADPLHILPSNSWGLDGTEDLAIVETQAQPTESILVVPNRHLAFGDSITWGMYTDPETEQPVGDYPARLNEMLNYRVVASEVINDGVPGEKTSRGRWRLLDASWPTYQPQFIELMEGTNDITAERPYNNIAEDLDDMVFWTKKAGAVPLLATLLPRQDGRNQQTTTMNGYIADIATSRNIPLVDTWQAFTDYGDWQSLLMDYVHPNTQGMVLLTQTWYNALLESTSLEEDITPPVTWVEPLPPLSECGEVLIQWNGTDNLSWVESYDVQYQVNNGSWITWLLNTQATSADYYHSTYGDILGFRVRGRDVLGNQSDYSAAEFTIASDGDPPYDVRIVGLPPAQEPPFTVHWSATDDCSEVAAYDVEYRVGASGAWQSWQSSTSSTSAIFDPASPQYGETYYFHTHARDQAGNWSDWSDPTATLLAQFTLRGDIVNNRHQPVIGAGVTVTDALVVESQLGHYVAYLLDEGDYDLATSHENFGDLPAMHVMSVTADLNSLDFVLPPLDDVIGDGGFESGVWGDWQPGGAITPTLITETHTGVGAALLGGSSGQSQLGQGLSVPEDLTDATLSFLVCLDDDADGNSSLHVELADTTISYTQVVSAGGWIHVWLPVSAAVGEAVTLTFTISGSPAVRLDEVSLGSTLPGGSIIFLPTIDK